MIIKIPKEQLRLKMYVESVECPAIEFDRKRFFIVSQADLQSIKRSSARWVNINIRHGDAPAWHRSPEDLAVIDGAGSASFARVKSGIQEASVAIEVALAEMITSRNCNFDACLQIVDKIRETVDISPHLFTQLTRLKRDDEITYAHSLSVSGLMLQLGWALDLESGAVSVLGVSGIVHDVGKLLIPRDILQKPSALTTREMTIMRNHPTLGYELLRNNAHLPKTVLDVCRHHHEHIDGSGYPDGISGRAVSKASRIAAICDVFDALTTTRAYKASWSAHDALRWMFAQEGKFDRKILLRFAQVVAP